MKNSEYWENRIANNTWTTYNNLEEKNRALLEMYQDASRAISDELYSLTEKMQTATPSLSDMHKCNRLTGLRNKMESIIKDLGENVEIFGKENMFEGFKYIYSNVMVQLGKLKFDEVPKKVMEEMLNRPWQGGTFSERLWKNTQVLAMNLNDIVTNGLTQGKTVTEMAIQLSNTMNTSFNISHRLIRTETMHYLNESAFKGYEDAGCEEVELWAAEDERTCEICGAKHGTKYKIKDRPILPLHANCRCTYLPVITEKEEKKTWEEFSTEDKQFSSKKEIADYLNNEYNLRFSDSRKYPIHKDILQDSVNWLDKFNSYFEGFKDINPVELPLFKIKPDINPVGYYSYYTNKPGAVELVLNGLYFTDKGYNMKYIEDCIKSKWTVSNAKGHKTFVHEYGHHVANSLKWLDIKSGLYKGTDWYKDFMNEVIHDYNNKYNKNISFKDTAQLVSRYGGTKPGEAFAEAFAEYFGGENPRDFAKVFGAKVENKLNEYIK